MLNASEIMELQKLAGMEKFSKRTVQEELKRQKLIELLNGLQDYGIKRTPGLALPGIPCNEIIADHLIANGVTVQKWIPVTERLPDKSDYYLAVCGIENINVVPYSAQYKAFNAFDGGGTTFAFPVSHWMPLPEPPKEK